MAICKQTGLQKQKVPFGEGSLLYKFSISDLQMKLSIAGDFCFAFVIVRSGRFMFCYLFRFLNQIRGNKTNSSHIRRNSIQSLALRCQDKRQALRA